MTPEKVESVRLRVQSSLDNFYDSPLFEKLKGLPPEALASVDEVSELHLDGIRIWIIPDLAVWDGDELVIYDWKTGSPSDSDLDQVATYALYGHQVFGVPADKLRTVIYYLPSNQQTERRLSQELLGPAEERVRASVAAMHEVLVDVPSNQAAKHDFAMTEDTTGCGRCFFQVMCWPSGTPGTVASA